MLSFLFNLRVDKIYLILLVENGKYAYFKIISISKFIST